MRIESEIRLVSKMILHVASVPMKVFDFRGCHCLELASDSFFSCTMLSGINESSSPARKDHRMDKLISRMISNLFSHSSISEDDFGPDTLRVKNH